MRLILSSLLLFFVTSIYAANNTVLVIYPEAPPPYEHAFDQLIIGLKDSINSKLDTYALPKNYDIEHVIHWVKSRGNHDTKLVLLGHRALEVRAHLPPLRAVFVGGIRDFPETIDLPGISLAVAPNLFLETLRTFHPNTKKVVVFYTVRSAAFIALATRTASQYGLSIQPLKLTTTETAINAISQVMETIDSKTTALWFMPGTISLNTELIFPFVLEETWKRRIVAFSESISYTKRGLLFSVYPDYYGVGVELGLRVQQTVMTQTNPITPTYRAHWAVNTRTAQRLGILERSIIQEADAIFPEF